jgi:hemerythrin superfamily protein
MTLSSNHHSKPSTTRGHADAITLLTADHKAVKTMFKQFAALQETGTANEKLELVQRLCTALTIHAKIEEEIFYPAVRQAIDDDDLMDEADVEHASAKALIAQLQRARPSDDHYDAKVTVLGELIDHHVKEEETEMFPKAKKAIDTAAVGAELEARQEELKQSPGMSKPPPPPRESAPMA